MHTLTNRHARAVLYTVGALLLAALMSAAHAEASTIYTCKKKSGTIHIVSKKAKCKKGETKLSWSSEGPAGKNGTNGINGTNGANGTNGTNGHEGKEGPAGSALAYAHVNADGTVDPTRSKNVTSANVFAFGNGAYCFHGLSFTPKSVVASLTNFTLGFITVGVPPDIGGVCESNVQARVETWNDASTPVVTNEPFEVVFN
jgi:hypothetical protein